MLSDAESELKLELNQRLEQKCFSENHNGRLHTDIDNMQKDIEGLEKRNKILKEKLKEVQKNAKKALELKKEMETSTERLKEQSSTVVVESYKAQMLEKGNQHLREEIGGLKEHLEKCQKEEEKTGEECGEMESALKELEDACHCLKQKNEELKENLNTLWNINEDDISQLTVEELIKLVQNDLSRGIEEVQAQLKEETAQNYTTKNKIS
eukprot:TRINITY_DN9362_c0_g3_i3.p1 TRINITY_DN9362_c0_g3~~TRINITY_DN9362_c0_g3_i3.p1  ORF type:complete len:210 (+),score=90.52 TRINITY_DN9362_c0_g3_i3:223-852(+)